jgi:predicted nuclease with TOPRIM domain
MDRATELTHLRKAEEDISKAHERIERQCALIARLREQGHDVTAANSMLRTMRDTLAVMEAHRQLIEKELSRPT